MKTLLSCITIISLCTGVAAWQQQSLKQIRLEIARLSDEIKQTRSAIESDQTELAELKKGLRELRSYSSSAPQNVVIADGSPLPDPQSEGWWPTNKSYFYLPKKLLKTVRFRNRVLKPEELPEGASPDTLHEIENQLFELNRLNPNMAALLGLTDAEKTSVEQTYSDLMKQVRALEAAAIQQVDPPRTNDNSGVVFARIPALKSEVGPLVKQATESLNQTLGEERTRFLTQQAKIYFNQNLDGLGSVAREFIHIGGGLSVHYIDSKGEKWSRSESFPYAPNRSDDWEYVHLFGPNGPVQLK